MSEQKTVQATYTLQTMAEVEKAHARHALEIFAWNKTRAAEALGLNRRTLARLIERHELQPLTDPGTADAIAAELENIIRECPSCSAEGEAPPEATELTCAECGHQWTVEAKGTTNAESDPSPE